MAEDNDELAEFDSYGAPAEGGDELAEFEAYGGGEAKPAGGGQTAPQQSDPSGLDYLLSLADGMSFGHGKSFENLFGEGPAKLRHPDAQITNPGMIANIPQTPGTKLAKAAGTALESVPLAIAAGPGIGAQAALGAATGGLSAHGSGEDVAGGAMLGGALGGLGGMVGKGLSALKAPAAGGQMTLPMKGAAAPSALDDAMRKLTEAKPDLYSAITSPWAAAKNAAGRATLTAAQKTSPEALRAAGQAGAGVGGSWFGDETGRVVGAAAAQAQDAPWNVETGDAELYQNGVRAVIGEPVIDEPWQVQTGAAQIRDSSPAATQSWAVESVLYQGNTGLPRDAEQQLTEAALSGDPEKLATATFLLSGKYPQFSDALQKQRASLIREEE